MKLLNKNTRYLLLILPVILLICSGIFFVLLRLQTNHLQRTQLELKQRNILTKFRSHGLDTALSIPGEYAITAGRRFAAHQLNLLRDTTLFYHDKNGYIPFKILTTQLQQDGKIYQLTTFSSSVEITHLMIAVFSIEGMIYGVLFLSIIQINRRVSSFLWKPFYTTMNKLAEYDINQNKALELPADTGITEFNELNQAASHLIARNRQAYQSQKEFVENASHEIQTPLAVIRSKVELLIEQPEIDELSAGLIGEIALANDRLSRMNRTLLLLSKIENNQFIEQANVPVTELIEQVLSNCRKQYIENFPRVNKQLQPGIELTANPVLMEILFNNLIRNAVVHNIANGFIRLALNEDTFIIENSGEPLSIAPILLFERFKKGNDRQTQGSGLGLALVKQICRLYHFKPAYSCSGGIHKVELTFR